MISHIKLQVDYHTFRHCYGICYIELEDVHQFLIYLFFLFKLMLWDYFCWEKVAFLIFCNTHIEFVHDVIIVNNHELNI